jgi:decaprenyl-phosphate phosphoribosyltransferase
VDAIHLIVRQARVRQWSKNVLVLAAPLAAGVLHETRYLWLGLGALLSFSLVASGLYVINDLADLEADRSHPEKAMRPLAAGQMSIPAGRWLAASCLAGGLAIAGAISLSYLGVVAVYAVNTAFYSLVGKRVATFEMLQVALGFVLRPVAGAVATEIVMSPWFLGVAMFGSLLLVAGKRSSELARRVDADATRPVLTRYSPAFLRQVSTIAASGVLLTYALWALAEEGTMDNPWAALSFAPVLFSTLRYVQLTDAGLTESPEVTMIRDPGILAAGGLWVSLALLGLYL